MKTILSVMALVMICSAACAEMGYVRSYTRRDGTFVSGHYKDVSRDGNPYNNRKYILGY